MSTLNGDYENLKALDEMIHDKQRMNFGFFVGILVLFLIGMHVLSAMKADEQAIKIELVLTRTLPNNTCIYAVRVAKPDMGLGHTDSLGRKFSGSIFLPNCPVNEGAYKLVPTITNIK